MPLIKLIKGSDHLIRIEKDMSQCYSCKSRTLPSKKHYYTFNRQDAISMATLMANTKAESKGATTS